MPKPGWSWIIVKADLEKKITLRKNFKWKNKDWVEYWCYRFKKTEGNIVLPSGKKNMNEENAKPYLHCIIVCPPTHVRKNAPDAYVVEGVKYEGGEVAQYLRTTGRNIS